METERIALSQRERDRLGVLHETRQKQITQIEAAKRLKISDRHIRRLLVELVELVELGKLGKRGDRVKRRLRLRRYLEDPGFLHQVCDSDPGNAIFAEPL